MSDPVSIIVPVYNEAAGIEQSLTQLQEKLVASGISYELIVVEDGSTDGTGECLDSLELRDATKLYHEENRGYGAALKTGIRAARYDVVVITDADGTYPVEAVTEILETMETTNADMVVGARTLGQANIPLVRRPAKWFITSLASYLAKTKIPDLNSGLRAMRKSVLNEYIRLLPDGFSFTSTITLAMLTNSHRVKYVPIDYFRRKGRSKIRPVYDTLNFVQLIVRMVLYFDPLRVFLPVSGSMILLGAFMVFFQVVLFQNITSASIIVVVTGIQLLAIGMLADLIDKRS